MTAESPPAAGSLPSAGDPARPAPWWQRHPHRCVAVVVTASALVMAGIVLAVFTVVIGSIKSSDVYLTAMDRVRHDPAVASALGTPFREGMLVTGNIHVSGPTGLAELEIPVSGPKASATVYVEATKQLGEWRFDHLIVQLDATHRRLDLLSTPPAKAGSVPAK